MTILFASSFVHKDINEYGKWLKFYGLEDEDFVQIGTDRQIKMKHEIYNLTSDYKKLYDNSHLYFYSPDSSSFLDLDSYNVILEKDSAGNIIWFGGDPEDKTQLVRTKQHCYSSERTASLRQRFGETNIFLKYLASKYLATNMFRQFGNMT